MVKFYYKFTREKTIKIIVLFLFLSASASAQNSDIFKQEIKPRLNRSIKKTKVLFWSDKKTYKIGEKIKIIVEWNKGNLINPKRFKEITNLTLIGSSYNRSYISGKKMSYNVYTFTANRTGKIKLTPFYIEYNFKTYKSCSLKFKVKED